MHQSQEPQGLQAALPLLALHTLEQAELYSAKLDRVRKLTSAV